MNRIIWKNSSTSIIVAIIIATIIASLMFVSFGLVMRYLVDATNETDSASIALGLFIVFFLAVRGLMPLSYAFIEYLTHSLTMDNEKKIRHIYFDIINRSNYDSITSMNRGEAQSLFNTAMSSMSDYTRIVLSDTFPLVLQTVFVLASTTYYLGFEVGFLFGLLIAIYSAFVIKMTNRRIPLINQVAISNRKMNGILFESLITMETSKAYNSIDNTIERYKDVINNNIKRQEIVRNEFFKFGIATALISVIGSALILMYSKYLVDLGLMTVGGIIMISTYLFQVFLPLNRIGMLWRQYNRCKIDFNEFEGFLSSLELDERKTSSNIETSTPDEVYLEIKGLIKKYPNSNFEIDNTSIKLKCNQVNFLVGKNGAGKSTLSRIIAGIDSQYTGEVSLTCKDSIFDATKIYMPQKLSLINDSVYNNILHFTNVKSKDKINRTLLGLCFDKPLDFQVGEAGQNLSGGEIQKLNLAIAILKKPKLLILDEPTNNIDTDTVNKIIEHIDTIKSEVIILIITHDNCFINSFRERKIARIIDNQLLAST